MTSNNYVIKTSKDGVKIVTINDFESLKFSVQHLLDAKDYDWKNFCDSLQLQITDSHIMVATTQNDRDDYKWKSSIKLMKVPIAEM
jgi:hypothetical protein